MQFVNDCIKHLSEIKGGGQQYIPVLVGLFKMVLIDEERMRAQIREHAGTMESAYNLNDALNELQAVYNFKKRQKEYFRDSYLANMEKTGARYTNI